MKSHRVNHLGGIDMGVSAEKLSRFHYFLGLSSEQIDSVKEYFGERKVERGEVLLKDNEKCGYVYFVVAGTMKIFKTSIDGKDMIVDVVRNGESLGEVSAFGDCASNVNAVAVTPVHLCVIRKKDLYTIISKYPKVAMNALRVMAARDMRVITNVV